MKEPAAAIGRAHALRRLFDALSRTPVTVLVLGEAGIGKTHLLAEVKRHAREAGARVLDGRARDFGGGLAYASLAEAFCSLREDPGAREPLRALLDAIDEAALGGSAAAPAVLAVRLLESLPGPTLIAIDDAHLADADTLSVLAHLPRRVPDLSVVVTARRPPALDADETITLAPLTLDEVTDLVTRLLGRTPSPATVRRIHEGSRGNPWFARELVLELVQGGAVHSTDPSARRGAILGRLFQRDQGARDLARVLAALRRTRPAYPTDLEVLAEVAGLAPEQAERAFDGLVRDGVVVSGEDGSHEFAHPLVAEALYADLGPAERRRVHARIAELLRRQGLRGTRSMLEWATHVAEGATAPDALAAMLEAARLTRVTAPLSAAHWYGRAADLAAPADRGALLSRQALSYWKGSRPRETVTAGLHALQLLPPGRRRVRTAYTVVHAADSLGNYDQALAVIDEQLPDADDTAALLAQRAAINAQFSRDTAETARRAWAGLAECPPEDRLITLTSLGLHAVVTGDWPNGERAVELIVKGSVALPPVARMSSLETAAHLLAIAGIRARALALLNQAEEIRRGLGWGDIAGQASRTMAVIRRLGGEWERALADIAADAEAMAEAGLAENLALLRNIQLDILLEQGRYKETEPIFAQPPPDCPLHRGLRTVLAARLAFGRGDRETTARLLDQALEAGPTEVMHRALGVKVMLHGTAGDWDIARELSHRLDEGAKDGIPRARLTAHLCAAAAFRDPERAEAALELARADGMVFEEAQARLVLGVHGDRGQLQRAHAIFTELGAEPWRRRAANRLREAGLVPAPTVTLTAVERRVAQLVAIGRSNPQIAEELHYSRKTVEVYLSRVYAKTGLRSRVELALAVDRGEL
ncbi:AAA family ATPase [Thermopolyspora sp. NPDC052614]|uniref:ATP-binding protein n=1 Tax=Thermopolyspora sp. NPDC052614 TaxID=3155682 RepID=UPI003426C56D